ncbi:MAG: phosphatidate cytidylyltransferase [Spartobacteria bacterium]
MSPSAALHDEIFRSYLVLVLVLLLGAGMTLALLQFVFRIKLGNVWKTYRGWLWMAPLTALFVFAGRGAFIAGVMALALLAAREFLRVAKLDRDRCITAVLAIGIVGLGLGALFGNGFGFIPIGEILLLLLVPILRNRKAPDELRRLSLGMLAFVYCGWMFGHLALFSDAPNAYGYICFLLFATEVTDVAAFTFGKMFGRHPLRSAISPGKTWEGALGALAVSLALPWLLRFSFPFFGAWQLVLSGLIVGLGGQLGDLAGSGMKRELGVKDWGAAISGHGGILDRIDSLIFVAPLFIWMTEYYYPGG